MWRLLAMLATLTQALRAPAVRSARLRSFAAATLDASATDTLPRIKVKTVLDSEPADVIGTKAVVKGWARTVRAQKKLGFLELNDGSSFGGLQCVLEGEDLMATLKTVGTGCAVAVTGEVVKSGGGKQAVELKAEGLEIVGGVADDYPLQKKRHSLEFLRSIAHLRPRTNTLAAAARLRSCLARAVHRYFGEEGFHYVHSPIITTSDCEGAGEMFRVTSLRGEELAKASKEGFDGDFFATDAFLTVSGQLSGEAYACALGDVYTFGPTFRAENSQTARHLAEFWMIEPEMAFAEISEAMDSAEGLLKYTLKAALAECPDDLAFCDKFYGNSELVARLEAVSGPEPFLRLRYADAVELLRAEIAKDPSKWQFPEVEFGTDLATEHERWLAEVHAGGRCVFVYDYPRGIKSFYMRDNSDGDTVAAFDLLAPGVGELVGGSQREERLEALEAKMAEFGLAPEDYWWYLDLRKYGSVPHAGYGLGFDRLVCYASAIENIRDAIPFPRYPGSAAF